MTATNTQAYFGTELIEIVKSLVIKRKREKETEKDIKRQRKKQRHSER